MQVSESINHGKRKSYLCNVFRNTEDGTLSTEPTASALPNGKGKPFHIFKHLKNNNYD